MRSISTALETYMIDYNKYPFDWDSRGWPYYLTDIITTPIAYLATQNTLYDVFRPKNPNPNLQRLRYLNYPANRRPNAWLPCPFPGPYRTRWGGDTGQPAQIISDGMESFGPWKLSSAGPDKSVNTGWFLDELYYDATNGTVSGGDIVLSAKGMK